MLKIEFSYILERMVVLLSERIICLYKRQNETCLLDKIITPNDIIDSVASKAIN